MKKLNNWSEITKYFSSLWSNIDFNTILNWFRPYVYTKEEVENIVKRIIHKDSFGDIHWEASKVAAEFEMNFTKNKEEEEELEVYKAYKKGL